MHESSPTVGSPVANTFEARSLNASSVGGVCGVPRAKARERKVLTPCVDSPAVREPSPLTSIHLRSKAASLSTIVDMDPPTNPNSSHSLTTTQWWKDSTIQLTTHSTACCTCDMPNSCKRMLSLLRISDPRAQPTSGARLSWPVFQPSVQHSDGPTTCKHFRILVLHNMQNPGL